LFLVRLHKKEEGDSFAGCQGLLYFFFLGRGEKKGLYPLLLPVWNRRKILKNIIFILFKEISSFSFSLVFSRRRKEGPLVSFPQGSSEKGK